MRNHLDLFGGGDYKRPDRPHLEFLDGLTYKDLYAGKQPKDMIKQVEIIAPVIPPKPVEVIKPTEQVAQWLSEDVKKFMLDNKIATSVDGISNEKQMTMQMIYNYDKYLDNKIVELLKTIRVIYG